MDRVDISYSKDGLFVASHGRVLLTIVDSEITFEFLDRALEAGRNLSEKYGNIVSITVAPGGVPLPNAQIRARATADTRTANAWVEVAVTIVGGSGFWNSAARSILTAITVLGSGPPRRVFGSAGPAIEWLARLTELTPEVQTELRTWVAKALERDVIPAHAS